VTLYIIHWCHSSTQQKQAVECYIAGGEGETDDGVLYMLHSNFSAGHFFFEYIYSAGGTSLTAAAARHFFFFAVYKRHSLCNVGRVYNMCYMGRPSSEKCRSLHWPRKCCGYFRLFISGPSQKLQTFLF
jgi:hypothetical protein